MYCSRSNDHGGVLSNPPWNPSGHEGPCLGRGAANSEGGGRKEGWLAKSGVSALAPQEGVRYFGECATALHRQLGKQFMAWRKARAGGYGHTLYRAPHPIPNCEVKL